MATTRHPHHRGGTQLPHLATPNSPFDVWTHHGNEQPNVPLDALFAACEGILRPVFPLAPEGFVRSAIGQYVSGGQRPSQDHQNLGEPLMDFPETRDFLGLSDSGLRRLVRSGRLRCVHIGKRRIAFDPSDVRAFVEQAKSDCSGKGGK